MKKILENSEYIFDASARAITFSFAFELQNILLITNLATATIIYRFDKAAFGAQSFTGNVLTLDFDTTAMSDSDILQIIVDIQDSGESIDLLGEISVNTALLEQTNIALADISKEATQVEVKNTLAEIESLTESVTATLGNIYTSSLAVQSNTETLNLEETQVNVLDTLIGVSAMTENVEEDLAEINTKVTGLNLETTQIEIKALSEQVNNMCNSINTLVQFLYANSPRIDVANRMTVNNSEVTQPVSGTVTASVANATVSNIATMSGQPLQYMGQDVPFYIYDNIKIT